MERFSANNRDQEGSVSSSRECIFKLGSTVLFILFQFQRRKNNHHIEKYGEPLKLDFHAGLPQQEQCAFSPLSRQLSHLQGARPHCLTRKTRPRLQRAALLCSPATRPHHHTLISSEKIHSCSKIDKSSQQLFTNIWVLVRN